MGRTRAVAAAVALGWKRVFNNSLMSHGALPLEHGGLACSQSDMGIAQRRKSNPGTPHLGSARICSAGHGYGPIALWTCQTLARRALRKVNDSISADRHVEKTSPIVHGSRVGEGGFI